MTNRLLRAGAALLLVLAGLGMLTTGNVAARQSADCAGIEEYLGALYALKSAF